MGSGKKKKKDRSQGAPQGMKARKGGETIAEQARQLLQGTESWRAGWRDYGVGSVRGVDREVGEGGR